MKLAFYCDHLRNDITELEPLISHKSSPVRSHLISHHQIMGTIRDTVCFCKVVRFYHNFLCLFEVEKALVS